ncbi:hypothetical protein [Prescottella agglutinans]|uniref:hypothetical protein n=1 Tax=Prescottella agglutinans TaxID=1644129 RepID=UPI003D971276
MAWETLNGAVDAGELFMSDGVARECAKRCSDLIQELKDIQSKARSLEAVEGFGDRLPSGVALAQKFARKASGGEYSLDRAIADHIAVVGEMRDVFFKIEACYAATEEAITAATTAVGSQIR